VPSDSPARIRLLAKFVEGTYEKVDKLLEIRDNATSRLKVADAEIEAEKKVRIFFKIKKTARTLRKSILSGARG
jgi:beta-catenin-like protein 1